MNVGFIGLGLMGKPMAMNIQKAGIPLAVYNRSRQKTAYFEQNGCKVMSTPKELADFSDVIITMVTASKDVEEILFSSNGVASSVKKALTVIDMSTIGPKAAKSIGSRLNSIGINFLDAPVTGGTYGATSGELTIFIGGNKKKYVSLKPLFESMGNNLHYMGEVGSGQAIKMINNFIIASSLIAVSEGMILADTMGLSRRSLVDALATTPAVSLAMIRKLPNYVSKEFPMNFTIKNMQKDLTLALSEAGGNAALEMLTLVQQQYALASESGLGDLDYSQVIDAIDAKS